MPQLVLCEICCALSPPRRDAPLLDLPGEHFLDLEVLQCWEYFVGIRVVMQLASMVE